MTFTADAICSRMARSGRSIPAIKTRVSSRARASRGELACTVDSEPSCPVFMACNMSRLSPPRPFADHDAVRAHAQRIPDEIANGDLALALDVRRPALQSDEMLLLELRLHRVLDRD